MPWFLKGDGKGKTCVVKGTTNKPGEVLKCYSDRAAAEKYLRALYKNAKDYSPVIAAFLTDEPQYAFARFFAKEGERTADGRVIDPHAVNFNRPPPLPIRLQLTQPESGGHAGATVCGVVTKVTRDGLVLVMDGFFDLGSEAGREALRLSTPGPNGEPPILQTWSPDLGDVIADLEVNAEDEDGQPQDELLHVVSGTMLGATICAVPALGSAVFEILDQHGNVLVPAPSRSGPEQLPAQERHTPALEGQGGNVIDVKVPMMSSVTTSNSTVFPIREWTEEEIAAAKRRIEGVTACGGPDAPPASFFANPYPDDHAEVERWTSITSDGHVYGFAAGRGECHIGYLDRCITIDDIWDYANDGDYAYAMGNGHVVSREGTSIGTGPIAIKGGHADKSLGWQKALAHYDDPSTVVADVCYYSHPLGIVFSGALRPTATKDMVYTLRASGVSLDARPIEGRLRYLATCCVNTGGLPKVSMRLAASAEGEEPEILALIGAGGPPIGIETDDCLCLPCADSAKLDSLTDRVFATLDSRISRAS